MSEAPPENGRGSVSDHSDEAPISQHHRSHHHHEIRSVTAERSASATLVKTFGVTRPARLKAALAAERSIPKMHWRWRRRGRDIVALLQSRFGSALPDDDAGADAAKLLAQHYMRLHIDAERVTRANLRLLAPWAPAKTIARWIKDARTSKTPSAAQLGKHWRVTVGEVAGLDLSTITAFTVTLEGDRIRQARRRRNAGAAKKRGRPLLELSPEEKRTRRLAKEAERKRRARASAKKSHADAYIRGMKRDELMRTLPTAALDLGGFDPSRFGVVGIQIMRGSLVSNCSDADRPGWRLAWHHWPDARWCRELVTKMANPSRGWRSHDRGIHRVPKYQPFHGARREA